MINRAFSARLVLNLLSSTLLFFAWVGQLPPSHI